MYLNDRRPNYYKTKSTKLKNLFGVDFLREREGD